MTVRLVVGSVIILSALGFGAMSFVRSNVEYSTFGDAARTPKKVQVKGEWRKDQPSGYDASANRFHFVMRDEQGASMPVVYDGPSPNNFELASSVVVKGRMEEGAFHATEILTKCPSKYEASPTGSQQ